MVSILVTGMSGAGKSTCLIELAEFGYETVDTDDGDWIEVIDGEPLWKPALMDELLSRRRSTPLFVQGTVANQGRWYDRFNAVVLMTAPLAVLLDRLRLRTNNPFGRSEAERARVTADHAAIEPILRASATHLVDTTRPIASVVGDIVGIARAAEAAERQE